MQAHKIQVPESLHGAKVREYHQSEIQTFLKCGLQWFYRYVEGIKTPPKSALTVGSSVDAAVSRNLIEKIDTGTDLPLSEVLDAYSTDFDVRKIETDWDGEDPGKQKDLGAKLVEAHHSNIAPSIQPATVQEKFVLETDRGFNLAGQIDVTTQDGLIIDTKTAKSKYAEDAISKALQPAMYDFAYESLHGKKASAFRYDVLVKPTKTKGAEVQQVQSQVTEADREWLFLTIDNVDRAINAGILLPAPENAWWCSKDWCGYWDRCKGAKK